MLRCFQNSVLVMYVCLYFAAQPLTVTLSSVLWRSLNGRRQSVQLEVNVYEEMKKECIGALFQDVSYFYSYKNKIHFYFHKNNLRTLREQNLEGGGGACPWTVIVFRVFPLKQFLCMVLRPRQLFHELLNLNLCDHTSYDTLIMQYY